MRMFFGCPPTPSRATLGMWVMGYEARVFSVNVSLSRSSLRVVGSMTTFSRTVPKVRVVS
jgi:hypothetical protein